MKRNMCVRVCVCLCVCMHVFSFECTPYSDVSLKVFCFWKRNREKSAVCMYLVNTYHSVHVCVCVCVCVCVQQSFMSGRASCGYVAMEHHIVVVRG